MVKDRASFREFNYNRHLCVWKCFISETIDTKIPLFIPVSVSISTLFLHFACYFQNVTVSLNRFYVAYQTTLVYIYIPIWYACPTPWRQAGDTCHPSACYELVADGRAANWLLLPMQKVLKSRLYPFVSLATSHHPIT